jgi:hypothetical protein
MSTGSISSNLDQDWYQFTAPAGATTIYVAVDTTIDQLGSNVTLYARSGGSLQRVAAGKDNKASGGAELRGDLTRGVEYVLAVESFKGKTTGDYTVNAEIDGNAGFSAADDLGAVVGTTTVTGEILDKGDTDVFTFTAGASGLLTFDNFAFTGTLKAKVSLYAADDLNKPAEEDQSQGRRRPRLHARRAGRHDLLPRTDDGRKDLGHLQLQPVDRLTRRPSRFANPARIGTTGAGILCARTTPRLSCHRSPRLA